MPRPPPSTTYQYAVRARDAAGNTSAYSPPAGATTPAGVAPFQNGFEAGFTGWTSSGGLALEGSTLHSGRFAAEGNTTNGATYAKKTVTAVLDGYARVYFNLKSAASQVNLLRMRSTGGVSLGYAFVTATGQLGWRNDVGGDDDDELDGHGPGLACARAPPARQRRDEHQRRVAGRHARGRHLVGR